MGSLTGDGRGNATLVWLAPGAGDLGGPIVARRFVRPSGWGLVETIDPAGDRIFQSPVAGMDSLGRTIVLWPEGGGLFASRRTDAWSAEERISRPASGAFRAHPTLGLSAAGGSLALWSAGALRPTEIAANRFDPASGWSTPEVVWASRGEDLSSPALAVSATGQGLAAWADGLGPQRSLWWTTFDPRRGWAVAQRLGLVADPTQLYGLDVALNAAGQGFLAWVQDDVAFVSRYTPVEGPGVPQAVGQGAVQGLEVDVEGNALALVNQPLGQLPGLYLRRFRASTGAWDPPLAVASAETAAVGTLSMDARGAAWILWCGGRGVWARRFTPAAGLLPEDQVSTASNGTVPQVVVDADGGALAVWVEVAASPFTIRAARYSSPVSTMASPLASL